MKMKNRIIALIMTLIMIISSVNFTMITSGAATTIDINNAQDLANLKTNVENATSPITINLNADIDASDISYSSPNAGSKKVIFNGKNHVIKNLNSNQYGLFVSIGASSSITNLGLIDCYVTNFSASGEGYGLLCGIVGSGSTITGCFAHGSLAVYGTGKSVGGLVGWFNGTMNNCFSVVDIHTDATYVGGLIGYYSRTSANSSGDTVSICYSTGTIDNEGRDYIGGLVGYSETSCLHQCYTTVYIKNPYADTVKSIGFVPDLDESVFYDENICFQRQGDLDGDHRFNTVYNRFPSTDLWAYSNTYYPQIAYFYNNENAAFKNISAISAAIVHINDGYGYEYASLSTKSKYNYAILTSNTGRDDNDIEWKITGGVDEYYYNSGNSNQTVHGLITEGLSGNIYDVNTGKYIFTTVADVVFTASSGGYERDITVHVSNGTSPYAFDGGGAGTSASPFIIGTPSDLDLVRMYCVDDLTGEYHYKLANDIDLSTDDSTKEWRPIIGFKGTLTGNKKNIKNLNVPSATVVPEGTGYAGLFGTVSYTASIDNLYIPDAEISANSVYSGILAGTANMLTMTNCVVSGMVSKANTAGQLIGRANDTDVNVTIAMGLVSAADNAGGLIGHAADANVNVTDCLTASTVMDAEDCGGIFGFSDSGNITTSLSNSILYTSSDNFKYGLSGGSFTATSSYFYENHAGIFDDENGKTLAEMTSADMLTALNTNSTWSQSNTKVTPYPNTGKSGMNYLVDNLFNFTVTIGDGTVENFTRATFNQGGYLFGESYDGYSVYGGENNNYSLNITVNSTTGELGYLNSFDVKAGGKEIFRIYRKGNTYTDVRYVIFDVKIVNLYYKVTLDGETNGYSNDMNNTVLAQFTDAVDIGYAFMLGVNSEYQTLPVLISDLKETVKVEAAVPDIKYTYVIEAYADANDTQVLTPVSSNTYSIFDMSSSEKGRYNLYINIKISQKSLDWGIYNIDFA